MIDFKKYSWWIIGIGAFYAIAPHSVHLMIPIVKNYEHTTHMIFGAVLAAIGIYLLKVKK